MKKIVGMLAGFITVCNFCIAQVPVEKTLLWEVTGKGIKQASYIYGTIHLMCSGDLAVPSNVTEKFNNTKELFLEIDLDDPNMMVDMILGMQMKDASTLQSLMGKNFKIADSIFTSRTGMSLQMLSTSKPILLMSLIYPSMLGCQPESWETTFQKMAKEKGMEIKGLEKLSDQMGVLEKIPYKVQADMLTKMITNLDSSKQSFNELVQVYKSKDINKLLTVSASDDDFGTYEKELLTDRNKNWIPVITKQAELKPTFFACGAGHLGGQKGILYLLREQGYTVKPIMYK